MVARSGPAHPPLSILTLALLTTRYSLLATRYFSPMNLTAIKQALLDSYQKHGGINHLDGVNLPAQDSVQQLASDYMHLMFPGFFEATALSKKDVPALVDRLLAALHRRLSEEIEKSLRFASDADPAGHARVLAAEALVGRLLIALLANRDGRAEGGLLVVLQIGEHGVARLRNRQLGLQA